MRERKEKIDWLTSRANRLFLLIVRTNGTIAITFLSFLFLSLSLLLSCSSLHIISSSTIIFLSILLLLLPMDNNPLTPRASSFSIASLITSDCCDDENSLYHSLPSPIGTNTNHQSLLNLPPPPSIEKINSDYYQDQQQQQQHFRLATLTETNNGQYQQQPAIKENRSTNHKHHHQVTNLQKSLTTIRNMEGEKSLLVFLAQEIASFPRLHSIRYRENQINLEQSARYQ